MYFINTITRPDSDCIVKYLNTTYEGEFSIEECMDEDNRKANRVNIMCTELNREAVAFVDGWNLHAACTAPLT